MEQHLLAVVVADLVEERRNIGLVHRLGIAAVVAAGSRLVFVAVDLVGSSDFDRSYLVAYHHLELQGTAGMVVFENFVAEAWTTIMF